jgi:hypothetical protein
MRTRISGALFALVLLPTLAAAAAPNGWFLAGTDPKAYRIDRDTSEVRDGKVSGLLASTGPSKGFGTMMQSFEPAEYLGKRVKLSAWVKAKDVKSWAGVWMRVDAKDKQSIAFDNMQSRPIQGTRDWKRYDIVLDVADNASNLSFGILMEGEGKVWLNGLQFDVVDASVPVTSTYPSSQSKKPTNLDFGN